MKNYYIRYYNDWINDQTLEQFIQAIATIKVLHLHSIIYRGKEARNEYVTIWEVDKRADYPLLDTHITIALENKKFRNVK